MKILLLFLSLSSVCLASSQQDRDEIARFRLAKDYSCFVYEHSVGKNHSWDRPYTDVSLLWYLVRKDSTAILIGQPSPFCEENMRAGKCNTDYPYWIRTVEFDSWWIQSGAKFVLCPSHLTKEKIDAYIKERYGNEFVLR